MRTSKYLSPGVTLAPCKSSNIAQLGHHNDTLYVQFATGGLFSYADFPLREYELMQKADSIGSYFAKNVRPKYKATDLRRMDEEQLRAFLNRKPTP